MQGGHPVTAISQNWKQRVLTHSIGGKGYHVREGVAPYKALFGAEKADVGPENTYLRNVKPE